MTGSEWAKLALLGGLIVQLGMVGVRRITQTQSVRLQVGMKLPYQLKPLTMSADDAAQSAAGSGCDVAFICTTECPYCAALALRLASEDFRTFGGSPASFFVGNNDAQAVEAWANDHDLPSERVVQLVPRPGRWFSPTVYGHVWSTPFRVVYDRQSLEIRDARPSDDLLDREQTTSLCTEGGISPTTLEEFMEIFRDSVWLPDSAVVG